MTGKTLALKADIFQNGLWIFGGFALHDCRDRQDREWLGKLTYLSAEKNELFHRNVFLSSESDDYKQHTTSISVSCFVSRGLNVADAHVLLLLKILTITNLSPNVFNQ